MIVPDVAMCRHLMDLRFDRSHLDRWGILYIGSLSTKFLFFTTFGVETLPDCCPNAQGHRSQLSGQLCLSFEPFLLSFKVFCLLQSNFYGYGFSFSGISQRIWLMNPNRVRMWSPLHFWDQISNGSGIGWTTHLRAKWPSTLKIFGWIFNFRFQSLFRIFWIIMDFVQLNWHRTRSDW